MTERPIVLPLTSWSTVLDLNHLYSQHQISLMRAVSAPSQLCRTKHQVAARGIAQEIAALQQRLGAAAAAGWSVAA